MDHRNNLPTMVDMDQDKVLGTSEDSRRRVYSASDSSECTILHSHDSDMTISESGDREESQAEEDQALKEGLPDPWVSLEAYVLSNMYTETPPATFLRDPSLPARVLAFADIKIVVSSFVKGKGADRPECRGIFVKEDVKEGDLIFAIPQPLLNIPLSFKFPTDNPICDNCFASYVQQTHIPHTSNTSRSFAATTTFGSHLKFSLCSGCRCVYYCSKTCQRSAWKHHHKYECTALAWTAIWCSDYPGARPRDLLKSKWYRATLRLLCQLGNENVKGGDWKEFWELESQQEIKVVFEGQEDAIKLGAIFLRRATNLNFPIEVIERFIAIIMNNDLTIKQPILKSGSSIFGDPMIKYVNKAGVCIDPFASILNHSCTPNVSYFHEGPALRIRATKDIPPGTELTICYTDDPSNNYVSQDYLFIHRHFLCRCQTCTSPNTLPRDHKLMPDAMMHIDVSPEISSTREPFYDTEKMPKMQEFCAQVIFEIKGAGYSLSTYPIRRLSLELLRFYLELRKWDMALKLAYEIYYTIDPAQSPALPLPELISDLYNLIQALLHADLHSDIDHPLKLSLPVLYYGHRNLLLTLIQKCWGKQSMVYIYEQQALGASKALFGERLKKEVVEKSMGGIGGKGDTFDEIRRLAKSLVASLRVKEVLGAGGVGEENGEFEKCLEKLRGWSEKVGGEEERGDVEGGED